MKMIDRLAAEPTDVGRDSIASVCDPLFAGDLSGNQQQSPEKRGIVWDEVGDRHDMSTRYDQYVDRRRRRNIEKGHDLVIVVDAGAGDVAADNAAENTIRTIGH